MFANMIREDERHDLSWEDILMKYISQGSMMKIVKSEGKWRREMEKRSEEEKWRREIEKRIPSKE